MPARYPPLFDGLNDVDIHTALRKFRAFEIDPGQTVLHEGESAEGLLCVLEGALEITSQGRRVGTAGPGDLVGEMALFHESTRTATVTATRPTSLLVLARTGYEELRDVLHPLAQSIEQTVLRLLVARLRVADDRIGELAAGSPREARCPSTGFFASVTSLFGRGGMFSADAIDPVDTLQRSALFADAPHEALEPIAALMVPKVFAPGHLICTEGELSDRMFLLDEGDVDVVVATDGERVEHLVTLSGGTPFGMVTLLEDRPRTSSCIARTRVVALVLDKQGWSRLTRDTSIAGTTWRRAMIQVLAEQVGAATHRLAELQIAQPIRQLMTLNRSF